MSATQETGRRRRTELPRSSRCRAHHHESRDKHDDRARRRLTIEERVRRADRERLVKSEPPIECPRITSPVTAVASRRRRAPQTAHRPAVRLALATRASRPSGNRATSVASPTTTAPRRSILSNQGLDRTIPTDRSDAASPTPTATCGSAYRPAELHVPTEHARVATRSPERGEA